MPVKIDPLIVEELETLDLVIWEAKHPKRPFFNEKTQKSSQREDKTWCIVSLTGPGVERECRAGAATLREAVDTCLRTYFRDRVPGVRGAMLRLEQAVFDLGIKTRWNRLMLEDGYDGDPDDFIPF